MKNLSIHIDPRMKSKFAAYPSTVRPKLEHLRTLIIETASEIESIQSIEETLKWGEPSYLVKKGSTIRMDWKSKSPDEYAIYFKCTSKLVETFKVIYGDLFRYEKTRALLFGMEDPIPTKELKSCISMALQYHTLKEKPNLGYSTS